MRSWLILTSVLKTLRKAKLDMWVTSKVVLVVDDQMDTARMKTKLGLLNRLAEKKRKLFLLDDLTSKPLDHERLSKRHKSVFAPMKQMLADTDMDPLLEVYSKFRTENAEKMSDDTVMVLTPSAPPNSPVNKTCCGPCEIVEAYSQIGVAKQLLG